METIPARERSTVPLSGAQYRSLEEDTGFWPLVSSGVLALERSSRATFGLRAGPFVGQAILGDRIIQIKEKIPGSLLALLELAQQPDARLVDAESVVEEDGILLKALIDRFLDAVDAYLVRGRQKVYGRRMRQASTPCGKMLVPRTLKRWAAGRRDQIVFEHDELTADIFLNRLVAAALHVVDGMLSLDGLDSARRRRCRTISLLFDDTDWRAVTAIGASDFNRLYERCMTEWQELASLISMARMYVLHFGVTTRTDAGRIPVSWFINLETLFEDVMKRLLTRAAEEQGCRATSWEAADRYLIPARQMYRTQPDLVVWRNVTPTAVLDTKFKETDAVPGNADVYQLLCHASAWGARRCALIYPADHYSEEDLGETATAGRLSFHLIDLRRPMDSARQVISFLTGPEPERRPAGYHEVVAN